MLNKDFQTFEENLKGPQKKEKARKRRKIERNLN